MSLPPPFQFPMAVHVLGDANSSLTTARVVDVNDRDIDLEAGLVDPSAHARTRTLNRTSSATRCRLVKRCLYTAWLDFRMALGGWYSSLAPFEILYWAALISISTGCSLAITVVVYIAVHGD
jgi:hypothetical protein